MSLQAISVVEGTFDVPAAPGTGRAKDVSRFRLSEAAIQATVSSGSYTLQGSMNGTTFVNIGSAITANTIVTFTHYWRALRIVTDTGGNGVFILGAFAER
jgi:hypothetical protein